MKLPEGIQAFFLLTTANVCEENERLVCATCNSMTYENMKDCLPKIIGDPTACAGERNAPTENQSLFL